MTSVQAATSAQLATITVPSITSFSPKCAQFQEDYLVGTEFAGGGQSRVRSVYHKKSGKERVLKLSAPDSYLSVQREGDFLKSRQDLVPSIPRCLMSFPYKGNQWALVMSKYHLPLFVQYICPAMSRKNMEFDKVRNVGRQLLHTAHQIHTTSPARIHADLHPNNILENPVTGVCTLVDFANSETPQEATPGTNHTAPFWRSPEISLGLPYDQSMDIFGIGITLAELIIGAQLFETVSDQPKVRIEKMERFLGPLSEEQYKASKVAQQQLNQRKKEVDKTPYLVTYLLQQIGRRHPRVPKTTASNMAHHITSMMNIDGKKRPTALEALGHAAYEDLLHLQVHRNPSSKKTKPHMCSILPVTKTNVTAKPMMEADLAVRRYWHQSVPRANDHCYLVKTVNSQGKVHQEIHRILQDSRLYVDNGKVTVIPLIPTKEEGKEGKKEESKNDKKKIQDKLASSPTREET